MAGGKRRVRLQRLGVVIAAVLLLGGMLAWPLVLLLWELGSRLAGGSVGAELSADEQLRTRSLEVFTALWFFWLGASVGSFLNVVVYRMPRGISLVWRPSSCPYCAQPIKARDNIPVLGWLLLGGRCRACRLPISARYPLVELTAGVLFVGLYFVELISGGANLPLPEPNWRRGAAEIIFDPQWDLLALGGYHAFLLSVLLAWALIAYDGWRIPARSFWIALLVGFAAPAAFPGLHPVPWQRVPWQLAEPVGWPQAAWLERLDTSLIGAVAGAMFGLLIAVSRRFLRPCDPPSHALAGLGLVGLFLGWQAALSIALLSGIANFGGTWLVRLSRFGHRGRWPPHVPWLGGLGIATCVQLAGWRWLAGLEFWPGPAAPVWASGLALLAATALHLPAVRPLLAPPTVTPARPPENLPSPGP